MKTFITVNITKLHKGIHLVIMALLIMLLSSCFFPGPERGGPGGGHERHGHNEGRGHGEGQDRDNHHAE